MQSYNQTIIHLKQKVMKTKTFLLILLATFTFSTVFATKLPSMNIVPVQSGKTLLAFENYKSAHFEVTITNSDNEILYYKKSEEPVEKYRTVLNFSELENDSYNLSLTVGNWTLNRKLTVKGEKVEVGEEVRLAAPVFSYKNDLLGVSFLNTGRKNVFINIYKNGEHVSGKKLGKEISVQKSFDLSNLGEGSYKVVLNDNFKTYSYCLEK